MIGDQNNFISLKKEKDSNVTFGDNVSAKIIGKGTISLGNKKVGTKNALLVEDLKYNLLSVSQMCDQGHTCILNSRECEIRQENSNKLVATTTRTQIMYTS